MLKRKLYDLISQRAAHLKAAEEALAGTTPDMEKYKNAMDAATALNDKITQMQTLVNEQERYASEPGSHGGGAAEVQNRAEEYGQTLRDHGSVTLSAGEVLNTLGPRGKDIRNSTTLATGQLAQPTGTGTNIREFPGDVFSSIIDQVRVIDLSGFASFIEPYVKTRLEAANADVKDAAGTARPDSDPSFGTVEISPTEGTVTSFVDRNLNLLSQADYYAKILSMALPSLRRLVVGLIFDGDKRAQQKMFGIKTAKNTEGDPLLKTLTATGGLTVDLLMELIYAYGGNDELGGNAQLYLTKQDLQTIGQFRGANEKRRLFDVIPTAGNPNTGTITDGGLIIPYTIASNLKSLSGPNATAAGELTMLYGDPANYELGLFGSYTIRVDESVKAVERMIAILGDVHVGGNLVVDQGFIGVARG